MYYDCCRQATLGSADFEARKIAVWAIVPLLSSLCSFGKSLNISEILFFRDSISSSMKRDNNIQGTYIVYPASFPLGN